jgi:predicted helicase
VNVVTWQRLTPDEAGNWLVPDMLHEFRRLPALCTKAARARRENTHDVLFSTYSLGLASNRDAHAYSYNRENLATRVEQFIDIYNSTVDKVKRSHPLNTLDDLIDVTDGRIKWTRQVKRSLAKSVYSQFDERSIRQALYRPFDKRYVYFNSFWNEERYQQHRFFPTERSETENAAIVVSDIGYRATAFTSLLVNHIPELHFCASTDGHQCFPFYVYDEDGSNRRENITDWALKSFREHYEDKKIDKWAIFYYVYGLLHHPGYREKYGDCLKRELPRIPFAPDFWAFSKAGKELAHWHLDYETVDEYDLEWVEHPTKPLSYRVGKMKLSKDKMELKVNGTLTLAGIPPETFEYRLGNRSALEWVIDQYQVKTDKRSGITSDPNREDDLEYIVRLVGRVITVSLETVEIVNNLPEDFGG